MATTRRPACEHCEPIDLATVAQVLGIRESYARKLAAEGRLLAEDGTLGATRWWWRHRVEAIARTPGKYLES